MVLAYPSRDADRSQCHGPRLILNFVVAGDSERDRSVMDLLASVLDDPNPFPHGLYWTGLKVRIPLM